MLSGDVGRDVVPTVEGRSSESGARGFRGSDGWPGCRFLYERNRGPVPVPRNRSRKVTGHGKVAPGLRGSPSPGGKPDEVGPGVRRKAHYEARSSFESRTSRTFHRRHRTPRNRNIHRSRDQHAARKAGHASPRVHRTPAAYNRHRSARHACSKLRTGRGRSPHEAGNSPHTQAYAATPSGRRRVRHAVHFDPVRRTTRPSSHLAPPERVGPPRTRQPPTRPSP